MESVAGVSVFEGKGEGMVVGSDGGGRDEGAGPDSSTGRPEG